MEGSVIKVRIADLTTDDPTAALDPDAEAEIAWTGDARPEAVQRVLEAPVGTGDGRSNWTWLRLTNGDLFLAVAPQGETYESLEGEPGTGWGE